MKKWLTATLALILVFSFLLTGTAFSVGISASSNLEPETDALTIAQYERIYNEDNYTNEYVSGEILVTLKDNIQENTSYESLFPEIDISSVNVISEKFVLIRLETITQQSVIHAINELKDNEYVYAVEPNYIFELASLTPVVPNDPYCSSESTCYQWHLSQIEADTA